MTPIKPRWIILYLCVMAVLIPLFIITVIRSIESRQDLNDSAIELQKSLVAMHQVKNAKELADCEANSGDLNFTRDVADEFFGEFILSCHLADGRFIQVSINL